MSLFELMEWLGHKSPQSTVHYVKSSLANQIKQYEAAGYRDRNLRSIAVLVNRPFAQAGLFRKVRGKPLPSWTEEIGCASWAQFFLKFVIGHPAVTCAIPGTSNAQHLADNMQAGAAPLPNAAMREQMARSIAQL